MNDSAHSWEELAFFIEDCYDAVSVWIENESGKIVGTVFGMESGSSIVAPA